ncbi:hypothetical protein PYCC9005_004164 [Savitreella phatthalungensis]
MNNSCRLGPPTPPADVIIGRKDTSGLSEGEYVAEQLSKRFSPSTQSRSSSTSRTSTKSYSSGHHSRSSSSSSGQTRKASMPDASRSSKAGSEPRSRSRARSLTDEELARGVTQKPTVGSFFAFFIPCLPSHRRASIKI